MPLIGELYDDQNQVLGIDSYGAHLLIVKNVGPGIYYLRVYGSYRDRRGDYSINATLVPRAPGVNAYLTQAVQSHDFGVPLVANEQALLRVFATANPGVVASMPPVRATFYQGEAETYSVLIVGHSQQVPWEMVEGDLGQTANVVVPADVIVPGTEMVVEIDPDGTLDPSLGVGRRVPAEGRMALDIRVMPPFNITAVPFLWTENPDSSGIEITMNLTSEHELFYQTREWLPVADISVSVRETVWVDYDPARNNSRVLRDLGLLYMADDASGYYMGVVGGGRGIAYLGGVLSVSRLDDWLIAHEFGHNLSLRHTPCGDPLGVDGGFPHANGRIGAWGYDRLEGSLVAPTNHDVMSYCRENPWISDYSFTKALHYRYSNAAAPYEPSSQRTLLVQGGVEEGLLSIEPTFVVDAPVALPGQTGPYRLVGADDGGVRQANWQGIAGESPVV